MTSFILPVLVCGVLSMVIGSIWYGPLFGKKWMEICKVNFADLEARKKMQKEAGPLYAVQFLLSLFQIAVLLWFFKFSAGLPPIHISIAIWAAFVMPTIAGCSMWTADSKEIKWARFLIQSGYQLVLFAVFAIVLPLFV